MTRYRNVLEIRKKGIIYGHELKQALLGLLYGKHFIGLNIISYLKFLLVLKFVYSQY